MKTTTTLGIGVLLAGLLLAGCFDDASSTSPGETTMPSPTDPLDEGNDTDTTVDPPEGNGESAAAVTSAGDGLLSDGVWAVGDAGTVEFVVGGGRLEIEIDLDIDPAEPGPFENGPAGVVTVSIVDGQVVLDELAVSEGWTVIEQDTGDGEVEVELRRDNRSGSSRRSSTMDASRWRSTSRSRASSRDHALALSVIIRGRRFRPSRRVDVRIACFVESSPKRVCRETISFRPAR